MTTHKKAAPVQEAAFHNPRKAHYTTTRAILAKAAPWLALQSLAVLVLTLSAGGLAP